MPHAVNIATPGLQALILCGPGSSFPTFMTNPDENPKALLPIANRPMVWYPLDFCYRAGITDITLVCPPSAAAAIDTALKTNPFLTSLPLPRPDLLAPKDLDQNTGTAQILRLPELQGIVKSDFLVLPCDLVCELGPDKLLQAWMVKSASLDDLVDDEDSQSSSPRSGGLGVWYPTKKVNPVKGEETDFVATVPLSSCSVVPPKGSLFPHLEKVVYSMPTDSLKDLIEEQKGYDVRQSLIEQYPRVKMLSTHRDAHIYIFPHWVMQFVRDYERFDSISEDVIGWWAKASWQKGLSTKLGLDKSLRRSSGDDDTDGTASPDATKSPKIDVDTTATDAPNPVVTAQENSSEDSNDSATPSEPVPVPPMVAYIHPGLPDGPLIRRVDTSQLLLQVSLQLAKLPALEDFAPGATEVPPFAHARKVAYPEGVKPRTTITRPDTLVGDNVTVQEKAHVKESVIGAGCQIGEGARLVQCLLMDGVVVGKNCKLTRCILGKRSEIGDGCVLTECEVQENLLVEAKTEAKGENFMSSSGLEATEEELEDALGGSDGGEGEEDDE